MFLNLAIFLVITALVIAAVRPNSKTQVWLCSILIPIVFAHFFGACMIAFSGSSLPVGSQLGEFIGGNVPSVLISIITLYICLNKKLKNRETYKYPKAIFAVILLFAVVGCVQLYLSYQSRKVLERFEEMKLHDTEEAQSIFEDNEYSFDEVREFRDGLLATSRKMTNQVPIQINESQTLIAIGVTDNLITYKYEIVGWDGNIKMSTDDVEQTKSLAILNMIRSQQYPNLFLECLRRMDLEFQLMFFSEDRKYIGGFRLSYNDFTDETIDDNK